jgi:hypothetical protein
MIDALLFGASGVVILVVGGLGMCALVGYALMRLLVPIVDMIERRIK